MIEWRTTPIKRCCNTLAHNRPYLWNICNRKMCTSVKVEQLFLPKKCKWKIINGIIQNFDVVRFARNLKNKRFKIRANDRDLWNKFQKRRRLAGFDFGEKITIIWVNTIISREKSPKLLVYNIALYTNTYTYNFTHLIFDKRCPFRRWSVVRSFWKSFFVLILNSEFSAKKKNANVRRVTLANKLKDESSLRATTRARDARVGVVFFFLRQDRKKPRTIDSTSFLFSVPVRWTGLVEQFSKRIYRPAYPFLCPRVFERTKYV